MDPITAGLILGGVSSTVNTIADIGKTFFNKAEARRNREFQREMRDTAIISSVNQAEKLGISPSLVLGQGSSSVGGSQASASGGHPMASAVDNLTKILLQDRQIDAQEQLAHEKAEAELGKAQAYYNYQINMAKINNSVIENDYAKMILEKEKNFNDMLKDMEEVSGIKFTYHDFT